MENLKKIADSYFIDNPDKKSDVVKAYYAYHASHGEYGAHYFDGSKKVSACRFCNRMRENVRWDDSIPTCLSRPSYMDTTIESVIKKEEELFSKVMTRATRIANDIVDINTITGEDLSYYHHTHGVDPSMLECAMLAIGKKLPEKLHEEYMVAYEAHSLTGKAGEKKVVLVAKTI
jgi:hypothetical protein